MWIASHPFAEIARLRSQEAKRTGELANAKRSVLQLQEALASREGPRADVSRARAQYLPLGAGETESVAESTISDATQSDLDVRPDENIFELRIVRATLTGQFFNARPSTFTSFDFFQHDTQASPMRQGLEPEYDFTAQFVLTVDDLFLHVRGGRPNPPVLCAHASRLPCPPCRRLCAASTAARANANCC